jgi:hypothetical protein
MKRGRPFGSKNKHSIMDMPPLRLGKMLDVPEIPRRISKEIRALSAASGVSPAQVLIDILDGGLINAREMYRTLIEYRKSLREQLEDDVTRGITERSEGDESLGAHNRNGADHAPLAGQSDVDGSISEFRPVESGLDLAPVGPRLSPEGDEAIAGDRGEGE